MSRTSTATTSSDRQRDGDEPLAPVAAQPDEERERERQRQPRPAPHAVAEEQVVRDHQRRRRPDREHRRPPPPQHRERRGHQQRQLQPRVATRAPSRSAAVTFMSPTSAASPDQNRGEQVVDGMHVAHAGTSSGTGAATGERSAAAATPDAPRGHADQRRDRKDLQSCRRVLHQDKRLDREGADEPDPRLPPRAPVVRRRRRARRPAAGPRRSAPPSRTPARGRAIAAGLTSVTASMLRRRHRIGRVAAAKTGTISHERESIAHRPGRRP